MKRNLVRGLAVVAIALAAVVCSCSCGEKKAQRQDVQQADSAVSQYQLGVPDAETVKQWRLAAEQGLDKAQFNLGLCYLFGDGVPKDETEAVKWFRKAAKQNFSEAQVKLGIAYDTGKGVPQDYGEAIKWYRKAAEQGDSDGYCMLGGAYLQGYGVTKDEAEAVKWYRKAAELGDARGQSMLGTAYAQGSGVPKDDVEAINWFRKAAEGTNTLTQTTIAITYNNLAWIFATSSRNALRDGTQAVAFAEQAVMATKRNDPGHLDTLACAYAETGQFEKAVVTEEEALKLLAAGQPLVEYETHLALFRAGKPYRQK